MKKTFIAIASILAIVAGCAKNNIENGVADGKIRATIESADTRATLNYGGSTSDNYLVWETGDKILLMNADSRVEATLTSGEGTKYGVFEAESVPTGTYYAVYPAAAGNRFISVEGDDSLFVEYPVKLTYNSETGNVENGGNIMIAKQSGSAIKFRNICSYLHFTITGEETQKVSKIVLEARGEGYLAGQLFIKDLESDEFYYENADLASKTVDITFPDGEVLSETGLSFNVALAPNCEYGFTATVYLTDGSYQELVSNETWVRNKVIAMPAFAFSGKDVAEIDGTKYKNLAAAVEAANAATSDVTITVLANAPFDSLKINNPAAKVTLDLNGYKISSSTYPSIVTETDCEIKGKTANSVFDGTVIRCTNGTLTINGGTYYGSYSLQGLIAVTQKEGANARVIIDENSEPVVQASGQAALFANGGKMNIASGTFINSAKTVIYTYGSDTVNITGGLFETTAAYYTVQAHSSSDFSGNNGLVQIDGGKFKSTSKYTIYSGRYHDLTINGGEFVGDTCICFQGYKTGGVQLLVNGGYFYTNKVKGEDIKCIGSSYTRVKGGYFNSEVESRNLLSDLYVCNALETPVSYGGKEYGYIVEEFTGKKVEVTIGGVPTQYSTWDEGFTAAKGASSAATIKLLGDVKLEASADFTNTNGQDVTLDLNNFTLSSSGVRNMIQTTGVLNITDNSADKGGMVTGSVNRVIYLTTSGTINISNCTIETSGTYYNTYIDSSAIVVHGTDAAYAAKLNIDNATIRTADGKRTSLFGIMYATVSITNSVITESSTGSGYYIMKTSAGAKVTITGTSMYSPASSNIHAMGSKGSASITIDNCWFYTGGNSNFSCSKDCTYDKVITAGNSYFNKDTRSAYSNWKVATGQNWGTESPAASHNHPGVGNLEYGYSIK